MNAKQRSNQKILHIVLIEERECLVGTIQSVLAMLLSFFRFLQYMVTTNRTIGSRAGGAWIDAPSCDRLAFVRQALAS